MQQTSAPKQYKKTKIFLSTAGIILLVVVSLFVIMMLYYTWQIRFGDKQEVEKLNIAYGGGFTIVDNSQQKQTATDKDISSFVHAHNPVAGNSEAEVVVLVYIDFACPFCQRAHPTFKTVMDKYDPAVKFVFKHLPLTALHPQAMDAAVASTCAQEQGQFWEYHDMLLERKQFQEGKLVSYAQELGLNTNKFQSCLSSQKYIHQIQQDMLDAADLGVRGTPTYFVNQDILEGDTAPKIWDTFIINHLK